MVPTKEENRSPDY